MKKIIFFDIDRTLFDVSIFLNEFLAKLRSKTDQNIDSASFQQIYESSREEKGYFIPEVFIDKLYNHYPFIDKDEALKIFWNVDLFEKSVYKDCSILKNLTSLAQIGIFSKGDLLFQKRKISFLNIPIDDQNIYIFPDKIEKAKEVFGKYKDSEIYLIDDNLDVLNQIKSLAKINLILIDRNGSYNDTNIKRIKSLFELKEII